MIIIFLYSKTQAQIPDLARDIFLSKISQTIFTALGKMVERKAIVIPFNPHLEFLGGSAVGSLIAHKWFADRHGAVFWDLLHAVPHPEIKTVYFYDTGEKAVTFKSKVEYMKRRDDIDISDDKYVPNWRKLAWNLEQGAGRVWLKLKDIYPLQRKYDLSKFIKSNGSVLRRVQNYAIVKDKEIEVRIEKITLNEMIDDHIFRLIIQKDKKLMEKDIEEIIWYFMLEKNLEYVDRQRGKDNRLDIAFKDDRGNLIVIEIKRDTANLYALEQIKIYMNEIKIKENAENIFGIILCRKSNEELENAVKKEKNIFIDKYLFSMDFPMIKNILKDADSMQVAAV